MVTDADPEALPVFKRPHNGTVKAVMCTEI